MFLKWIHISRLLNDEGNPFQQLSKVHARTHQVLIISSIPRHIVTDSNFRNNSQSLEAETLNVSFLPYF
jgi:hypothetical protein